MCGIYGQWNRDGSAVRVDALERATTALRHRGPDDEGYLLARSSGGTAFRARGRDTVAALTLPHVSTAPAEYDVALGFRRLAILDLSPAGHQPMQSLDGRYSIVFNGEIYNYIELRAELQSRGHRFRSGTDTEVILAAYGEWGSGALSRFNGMWAFAIWDAMQRELFIARDRFGIKPFHYAVAPGGTFAFASEIKALLASGCVAFDPDPRIVGEYVRDGALPSAARGETFLRGVHALPPAHCGVVTRDGVALRRYWSIPEGGQDGGGDPRRIEAEYRELFVDAVRTHLRADVAVGTCLSGGVDSSSVVGVISHLMKTEHDVTAERLSEHQRTFSAVYDTDASYNERVYVDRVVAATGADANYVTPRADELWRDLRKLVWHQDEPFTSTSMFAQWCVMRLARERGVIVVLDGQGADEVLGGYHDVYPAQLRELIAKMALPRAFKTAARIRAVSGYDAPRMAASLLVRNLLGRNGGPPNVDALLRGWIAEAPLPHLLRYEDRNSMAFSIESRVPFLDYRLVEFAFTRGAGLRVHDGWTKWIQRRAAEPFLTKEIMWRRDKVGFATPEREWIAANRARIGELIAAGGATEHVDVAAIRKQLDDATAAIDLPFIWRVTCLATWLDVFGSEVTH